LIPLDTILVFIAASAALAVVPGPDNVFVLTQSALHGRKAGVLVTLGLCTGLVVHTSAVALGVATIFQASEVAFNTLKFVGALYLVYLAWQAFHASSTTLGNNSDNAIDSHKLYLRGVIMNITNPKVAIFFLAFLPQFADPSKGSITTQMLLLGALFMISTLLIFGGIAWTSGFLGDWLKSSDKAQKVMNRVAGTVFIGLAVRLALTER